MEEQLSNREETLCLEKGQRETLEFRMSYQADWVNAVRRIPGRRWDPIRRCWEVPDSEDTVKRIVQLFAGMPLQVQPQLTVTYPELLQLAAGRRSLTWYAACTEWMKRKGFSGPTQRAYLGHMERFLDFSGKPVDDLQPEDVHRYLLRLLEQDLSRSYVNQAISALRGCYQALGLRLGSQSVWHRPKRVRRLPDILSREEVLQLFGAIANERHWLILTIIYSAGLRIGEAVRLRFGDFDAGRGVIHIRLGKGGKDRYTILSSAVARLLEPYFAAGPSPKGYLFPGATPGRHLHERTIQYVLRKPSSPPESTSPYPSTPFATASPPTCSRTEPSRNYSATRASKPPRSTPTSPCKTFEGYAVHWIGCNRKRVRIPMRGGVVFRKSN